MASSGLVKSRSNHLAAYGTLHFGDLFGALVNQQHNNYRIRVVGGNGMGHMLHHHGFTRLGASDDECEKVELSYQTTLDKGWYHCPLIDVSIEGTEEPDKFVLLHGHLDS